ncbi:MAG: DUF3805 domain-containing protein [Acidobacteria bacterium]|nr:DUF3805 domain-containing protein [Acidobacteriota bacterium]
MIQNNNNKFVSKNDHYSLMLPEGWVVDEEEDCTSFFNPDGNGALQISQYCTDTDVTSSIVIREFLASVGAQNVSLYTESTNRVDFATCSYVDDDDYFRIWVATTQKFVTLITYNCPMGSHGTEVGIANEIVSSLEFV